jgi:NAD(P)-dependent dehydrogenase (short-subunit alcohol dehydrogenase family)
VTSRPRVVVITGGTHGIGLHIAGQMAGGGWSVAVCSRDHDHAARVAAELAEVHGVATHGAGADVRSADALRAFAHDVVEQLGVPTAAVANAAVPGPVGALHTVDLTAWADAVAIDLIGVANTFAVFGALMAQEGRGRLVTISGGGIGGPRMLQAMSAYTCSKAALVALAESVAEELGPFGVSVNAVAPGAIATRFMDSALAAGPDVFGERQFAQVVQQRRAPDSLERFDDLLRLLLDSELPNVTGRVLSARWEDPDVLRVRPPAADSPLYRMRRIDNVLYVQAPPEDD